MPLRAGRAGPLWLRAAWLLCAVQVGFSSPPTQPTYPFPPFSQRRLWSVTLKKKKAHIDYFSFFFFSQGSFQEPISKLGIALPPKLALSHRAHTRRLSKSVALRELRLFSGQWPGSEEELGSSPCPALHCSLLTFASSQHLAQFFFGDSFPGAWKPFCDFLTFYETVFFWLLRGCATG